MREMKARLSLLILLTGLLASCNNGPTTPEPGGTTGGTTGKQMTGEVYVDVTASGETSPYKREDAAGKTLELRLSALTQGGTATAPVSTTVIASNLTYKLTLPTLSTDQLGTSALLPSKFPIPAFTNDCYVTSKQLTDDTVKVRAASLNLVFPNGQEPMVLVYNSGNVSQTPGFIMYTQSLATLVYVDKDVSDQISGTCNGPVNPDKGIIDTYYHYSSMLNLKAGWNVVVTTVNVTENGSGAGAMTTIGVNTTAEQDFYQLLMSGR